MFRKKPGVILEKRFHQKAIVLTFALISLFTVTSCGEGGYYDNGPGYDDYEAPMDDSVDEPYDGYSDNYDQDCADVGEEVWVGDDDPDGLDADGDGWGCETWP